MARDWWRACRKTSWKVVSGSRNNLRRHFWQQVAIDAPADDMAEYLVWRIVRKTPYRPMWLKKYFERAKTERFVIESLEATPQRITISKARELLDFSTMEQMRDFLQTRGIHYGQI